MCLYNVSTLLNSLSGLGLLSGNFQSAVIGTVKLTLTVIHICPNWNWLSMEGSVTNYKQVHPITDRQPGRSKLSPMAILCLGIKHSRPTYIFQLGSDYNSLFPAGCHLNINFNMTVGKCNWVAAYTLWLKHTCKHTLIWINPYANTNVGEP